MKRLWMIGMALATVVVVTACRVAVDGPPVQPGPVDTVAIITAQGLTTDPSPRAQIPVPAGASRWIELRTGPAAAVQDLVYLEAEGSTATSVGLELYRSTNVHTPMLVSRSPDVFAVHVGALPFAAAGLGEEAARSVTVEWTCLGACVAWEPVSAATRYYARITNLTGSHQTVRLYAYGRSYGDDNEPNDGAAAAAPFTVRAVGDSITGALETVDDRDFFQVTTGSGWPFANVELRLASEFDGDIVMQVGTACDGSGAIYDPGQTVTVSSGATVCVRTLDGTAGTASSAFYAIIAE